MTGILILGAGQAGAQAAASLRAEGFDGPITLIGDEPHAPYQRPPLSKAYLAGKMTADRLALRGEAFWADNRIELITGERAIAIDRTSRTVAFASGRALPYGRLVLATGARPRPLPVPGADLEGVLMLRSIADADALRAHAQPGMRAVVVGGGFIGLECAASLIGFGLSVTVIEALPRLMARAVMPETSEAFAALHRARGVDLHFGTGVMRLLGADGRVTGVERMDGSVLPADLVVAGIGAIPNAELAAAADLAHANGIVVDATLATSDPAILAIGDCAVFPCVQAGGPFRLESVQNAIDQGKAAAATLLGRASAYSAVPWFWSDQFDAKLQMAGLAIGVTQRVTRGDPMGGRFSVFAYADERLVAVDSINRPGEHMLARRLLEAGLSPSPEEAGDENADLKRHLVR